MSVSLSLAVTLACLGSSQGAVSEDAWKEAAVVPELTVAKSYVRLSSPLVALEAPSKGQVKLAFDQSKFQAIQDKIQSGHKHIRLIDTGVEDHELELSPFDVFTQDAVLETDQGNFEMPRPEMIFLRGKVAGDDDSFVSLHMGRHAAYGVVQSRQRTWQVGTPNDRSAHSFLLEVTKDTDGSLSEKEKEETESVDTQLTMPVQFHKDLKDTKLAQTKARSTTDNFDSTGTQPVLTIALECDQRCRDLFQASGECLTEIRTLEEDPDSFEELASAREKLTNVDKSSSCSSWVSRYSCTTTFNFPTGETETLQTHCPVSCGATPSAAPTPAPTPAPTNAQPTPAPTNAQSSSTGTDKSSSCSSWVSQYSCTTTFNFPTGETETLQEHCGASCGPTNAPTPAPTFAAGDGVAGCTHPAATYIAAVIAGTSSIYSRDVGVTLQIQYMKVWSGATTGGYDSGTASLNAFQAAYAGATGSRDADIAHLFTGIVEGGLAYVGTACNNAGYNTGVSSIRGTWTGSTDSNAYNWDLIVTAHEMGHNIGSGHTHDVDSYSPVIDGCVDSSGSAVSRTSAACVRGTIMSYCHLCGGTANIDMAFADRVKTQIRSTLTSGTCGLSLS